MRKLAIFAAGFSVAVFTAVSVLPGGALLPLGGFCVVLACAFWLLKKWLPDPVRRRALLCAVGLICGMVWTWGYNTAVLDPARGLDDRTVMLSGTVLEWPEETDYGARVMVRAHVEGGADVTALLYIDREYLGLQPGDRISAVTHCALATHSARGEEITYYTAKGIFLTGKTYGELEVIRPDRLPLSAYPAMLTKVPNGWLGIVAASMMGALFSTIAAHLNMGSSYMVNDFWKRFARPKASDRELIWVGRASMLLLLLLACCIAPHLKSAKGAFDLMLLIGAGSGSIFLLRWFWMRINAWTEITGIAVSFIAALVLQFGFPELASWQKMLATIVITTVSWLAVTLLTAPTDEATASRFKAAVRAEGRDVGKGIMLTALASFAVFDMMYSVGAWIYGWYVKAMVSSLMAVLAAGVIVSIIRKKKKA